MTSPLSWQRLTIHRTYCNNSYHDLYIVTTAVNMPSLIITTIAMTSSLSWQRLSMHRLYCNNSYHDIIYIVSTADNTPFYCNNSYHDIISIVTIIPYLTSNHWISPTFVRELNRSFRPEPKYRWYFKTVIMYFVYIWSILGVVMSTGWGLCRNGKQSSSAI